MAGGIAIGIGRAGAGVVAVHLANEQSELPSSASQASTGQWQSVGVGLQGPQERAFDAPYLPTARGVTRVLKGASDSAPAAPTLFARQDPDRPAARHQIVPFEVTGSDLAEVQNWIGGSEKVPGSPPAAFEEQGQTASGDASAIPLPPALRTGLDGLTALVFVGLVKRFRRVLR